MTEVIVITEAPNYAILVERIGKVERENRRMKRALLALFVLPLAFVLMGQAPATRVVDASEFVLRDASGHIRARLWFGLKPTKSPTTALLSFYDSTGKSELINLGANGQDHSANLTLGGPVTPSLNLSANAKGSYASFETAGNPQQGVVVSAEPGKSLLNLSSTGDPLRGVKLTDGGEGGVVFVNDATGDASVLLKAQQGTDGVSVTNTEGRQATLFSDSLSFGDGHGSLATTLYGGKEGPFLNLLDDQGFKLQFGVSRTIAQGQQRTSSAASMSMFNSKGQVIWSAP